MGRELKKVPLDFDWPTDKVWDGFLNPHYDAEECPHCDENSYEDCQECDDEGMKWYSEKARQASEAWTKTPPPTGPGFQMWENTSEGSPQTPVFKTLDELCVYCEEYATTFASFKASAKSWKQMLEDGLVFHKDGKMTFI